MERSSQSELLELSDYFAAVRRRWVLVALTGFLGFAAAAAYTVVAAKTYTATAAVFVTGNTGSATQIVNGRTTGVVDLDTEAQIVQSASVAHAARHILHSPFSATALSKRVNVTVPPNSQVLQISCDARTAANAARCANAFASAYLQSRASSASAQIQTQLTGLRQQVSSLQQRITSLNARIGSLPRGSAPRVIASTNLSLARSQLDAVSNRIADLTAQAVTVSSGRIITDAVPPSGPSSPQRRLYLPGGLSAGLLLGLVIAFWRDRSDKRVRSVREVEALLDLPVLLHLPPDQRRSRLAIAEPRTRTGQAFAELAHSLASTLGQGNHVVLVAGGSPGYAGSVVAANVAAALARTGSEVALVCADLRGSVAPRLFGLANGTGLAEVILDRATVTEVERPAAGFARLRVITPGVDGEQAADHLDTEIAERLVSRLHAVARHVIFEVAPGAYSADVFAFAERADAAVVAVELARTLRPEVEETVRRLDKMGAAVLGAVLLPSMAKATLPGAARAYAEAPPRAGADKRRPHDDTAGAHSNSKVEDQLVYPSHPQERAARARRTYEERYTGTRAPLPGSGDAADAALSRPLRPLPEADSPDGTAGSLARD